jgi:hypothetical protein
VSVTTVKRIMWHTKYKTKTAVHVPGKGRTRKIEINVILDDFYLCIVKGTLLDYNLNKKIIPTCKKLSQPIKGTINFP